MHIVTEEFEISLDTLNNRDDVNLNESSDYLDNLPF